MSPRARSIIDQVASEYGVTADDILGRSQRLPVRRARSEAMRRMRALAEGYPLQANPYSYPAIGRIFGRDHSTVVQVCRP